METADILTMILLGLIVAVCWIVVPGLIAGWVFREGGRKFGWGLGIGALLGPVGVVLSLVLVSVTDRVFITEPSAPVRPHLRDRYVVPILGNIHSSTAWTLAGLATFMCVWMLGGIAYEVFYNLPRSAVNQTAGGTKVRNNVAASVPLQESSAASNEISGPASARAETSTSQVAPMLGAVTAQPPNPGHVAASASPALPSTNQAASLDDVNLTGLASGPQTNLPAAASAPSPSTTATVEPAKSPGPSRAAIISEVTSSLGARGYRAHATVSGDARTSTLSISCATLTRAAGNQLLLNSRTRQSLKAAGIRIVVMINGQESWSYML